MTSLSNAAERLLGAMGLPDLTLARAWMCSELLARGISPDIVQNMEWVPRHAFAPRRWHVAYSDLDLWTPTGWLKAARTVGLIANSLNEPSGSICELGTGPGYQTAVLAAGGASVTSIDHDPYVLSVAQERLRLLGLTEVRLLLWPSIEVIPSVDLYNAVVINFAVSALPLQLVGLLQRRAEMIVPTIISDGSQRLLRYLFLDGQCRGLTDLGRCRFPRAPLLRVTR